MRSRAENAKAVQRAASRRRLRTRCALWFVGGATARLGVHSACLTHETPQEFGSRNAARTLMSKGHLSGGRWRNSRRTFRWLFCLYASADEARRMKLSAKPRTFRLRVDASRLRLLYYRCNGVSRFAAAGALVDRNQTQDPSNGLCRNASILRVSARKPAESLSGRHYHRRAPRCQELHRRGDGGSGTAAEGASAKAREGLRTAWIGVCAGSPGADVQKKSPAMTYFLSPKGPISSARKT